MDEERAVHAKLSTSLAAVHDLLLRSTGRFANKSVDDFSADESFLGPLLVACGLTNGKGGIKTLPELSYGGWPAEGGRVAVGIRSLSKMVSAATYLALVERGEGGLALNSRLGLIVPECTDTSLASATAMDAMSMRSPLDNRLSAAWGASQGMADHASFPPECDGKGLTALQCVLEVVCPRYGAAEPEDVSAGRARCEDRLEDCGGWAAAGECESNPNFMVRECEVACGACLPDAPSLAASQLGGRAWWSYAQRRCEDSHAACVQWSRLSQCDTNAVWMLRECPAACGVCNASLHLTRQLELRRGGSCRYDNYAYTLLDAMVQRRTGRPLWRWSLELLAVPLGMEGMIRCIERGREGSEGVAGCFAPPRTPHETVRPASWHRWRGGVESTSWASSNGLFGSAQDLLRFLGLLANGGELEGKRLLDPASVRMLFSDYNDHGQECQGFDTFGLGIGHCVVPDEPFSRCRTHEWWGWGSTYGSRVSIIPASRLPGTPALVCATLANIATDQPPKGVVRLASRQHKFAHAQAAALRHLFPLLPAGVAGGEQAFVWLASGHNLSAALEEVA